MSRVRGACAAIVAGLACALCAPAPAPAQQVADTSFSARVAVPAYENRHPEILFDEAHDEFHTSEGSYRAFADLARSDGYRVVPGKNPFSRRSLSGASVLVIANALGYEDMSDPRAERSAFTDDECNAVRNWVRDGGALLLIVDHSPMPSAASRLAARFGVTLTDAYTVDPDTAYTAYGSRGLLVFSRANGLLGDHPITRGRDSTERVRRIMTFGGSSIPVPPGVVSLLTLSPSAVDLRVPYGEARNARPGNRVPVGGRSQGIAFEFGRGRVVVLAEAGMLSAQTVGPGDHPFRMGMNHRGVDNRRLAVNILHWLTRVL